MEPPRPKRVHSGNNHVSNIFPRTLRPSPSGGTSICACDGGGGSALRAAAARNLDGGSVHMCGYTCGNPKGLAFAGIGDPAEAGGRFDKFLSPLKPVAAGRYCCKRPADTRH